MRDLAVAVIEWMVENLVPFLFLVACIGAVTLYVILERRNPCLEYSHEPPVYVQVGKTMVPVLRCLKREKE